jgi:hypothetical protein
MDTNLNYPKKKAEVFHIKLKRSICNGVWDTWGIKLKLTDSFCWKPSLSNFNNTYLQYHLRVARKRTFKSICKSGFLMDKYC